MHLEEEINFKKGISILRAAAFAVTRRVDPHG